MLKKIANQIYPYSSYFAYLKIETDEIFAHITTKNNQFDVIPHESIIISGNTRYSPLEI